MDIIAPMLNTSLTFIKILNIHNQQVYLHVTAQHANIVQPSDTENILMRECTFKIHKKIYFYFVFPLFQQIRNQQKLVFRPTQARVSLYNRRIITLWQCWVIQIKGYFLFHNVTYLYACQSYFSLLKPTWKMCHD